MPEMIKAICSLLNLNDIKSITLQDCVCDTGINERECLAYITMFNGEELVYELFNQEWREINDSSNK